MRSACEKFPRLLPVDGAGNNHECDFRIVLGSFGGIPFVSSNRCRAAKDQLLVSRFTGNVAHSTQDLVANPVDLGGIGNRGRNVP